MLNHQCLIGFSLRMSWEYLSRESVLGLSQSYMYNLLFFEINYSCGETHWCRKKWVEKRVGGGGGAGGNNPSSRLCSLSWVRKPYPSIYHPCPLHTPSVRKNKHLHPTEQFDISFKPLSKSHWTYLKTWNDVFHVNENFGNADSDPA